MNRDETAETIRRPRAFILSSAPQSLPTTPGMIQSSFPPAARGLKHGGHYKCGEETLIANTLLTTPEGLEQESFADSKVVAAGRQSPRLPDSRNGRITSL